MITAPIRVSPPAAAPVSLEEMKAHVRIEPDMTEDDTTLQSCIDAAVTYLDGRSGVLGRCLIDQEWRVGLDAWQSFVLLPFPNVSAATVTYTDADGDEQTVSPGLYEIVETDRGAALWFSPAFTSQGLSSEVAEPIVVTFTAGYGAAATDVPWGLRVAIMQLAATWYRHSEILGDASEMPMMTRALIAPFRRVAP